MFGKALFAFPFMALALVTASPAPAQAPSIVPPPAKQRAREARANAAIEDARLEAAREAESGSGLAPTGVPSVPAAPS